MSYFMLFAISFTNFSYFFLSEETRSHFPHTTKTKERCDKDDQNQQFNMSAY